MINHLKKDKIPVGNFILVDWHISTGFVGATHQGTWEISREEWDSWDEEQKSKQLNEMLQEEMSNNIDAGYYVNE